MPQKMIQGIYHFHSKEGNTMNKIYKVIWSKAKHTYVVASEIAKGHTKGETTGKGLKKLAAAMLVAAALLSPSFAWAADTVKVDESTSPTAVEVYTKGGADSTFATVDQLQADVSATNAELVKKANQTDLDATNKNLANKANQTDLDATNKNLAKKANQTDLDATNENLAKKADKATTLEGYGITDAYTKTETDSKFATVDQLQADVAATNEELAKKADKATTLEGYGITDAYTKTEVVNKVDAEKTARESADLALGSRTSALEAKTGSLNRVAAANSTSINESMTLKDKQYSATLQVNGSGAQIGVVNNSAAGLANDGGTAYTEYRARAGAILSKATNDISSTSSNGQVVDTAGDTTGEYSQVATAKSTGTTFTYSNDGGKTSTSTTIKGDSVSTGTVSATAGITDGTTTDGTSVKASQTVGQNLNALDERITNVKEYVLSETVSKTDAAVQDGAIVKAANTIGDNVTKLDAALAKETAARIGADKAQDKVIQQVNQNMVEGFNTINKNMAAGFNALSTADANELAGRVAADTELVKATNGGLALNDKNVLQKNETTIENGTVTTKTTAADTLIMNEGATNQITLSKNGIKVGTNSTVIASDGVFAGGDTADKAKAALNADGSIKGADGAFTVDKSGNVTSNGTVTGKTLTDGIATLQNGNLNTTGNVNAHDIVATGDISGGAITGTSLNTQGGSISGGAITGTSLNTQGGAINGGAITGTSINGTTGTFGSLTTTGNASVDGTLTTNTLKVNQNATVGGDLGVTGDITGKSLNVGTGDIKGGQITGTGLDVGAGTIKTTGAVETGTLETTGNATIGGDLTVKGTLNVDEIDLTKTGIETGIDGDYHVTSSTKVAAGKITSYKKATSAKDGSEKESGFGYDENGTSTWAQSTDADKNWNKSTLTVEGNDVTSTVVDSNKNKNVSTQTAGVSSSVISGKDGENTYKSYITQNLKQILQKIEDGNGNPLTSVEQTEKDITNTAKNGTITNDADKVLNQGATSVTSQIGDGTAVKSELTAGGITNTAVGGTISNSAKDLVNTATGNMTNTVGGTLTTTVTGKVTEDYKSDLDTKVGGNETHYVKGNQTNTVSGDRTVSVKGTETENFNAQVTNIKTDQRTSVGGNQTNIVAGNQQNTVSGSKTETVKGSVTEKYGNQATTVDGDQSTNVGGNQSNVVAGNQTNTISGSKTESVKGAVTETYGNQSTTVNGNQSNTVKGTLTETVTGDVTEDYKANLSTTVGGNQTTTVTGDSSLSAKNITNTASETLSNSAKNINNTATEKLSNSAADIENKASNSILNQVGENTSWKMTDGTVLESINGAGGQTNTITDTADSTVQNVKNGKNELTSTTSSTNADLTITNGSSAYTKVNSAIGNKETVAEGDTLASTNLTKDGFNVYAQDENGHNTIINNASGTTQTIQTDDEHLNVTTKTVGSSEEKLTSGSSVIDVLKSFDDAANPAITSSVSDGTNTSEVKQTAKDITNTAKNGTITNDAKDLVNNASENMTNTVGKDLTTTVGGEMKTTVTGDSSLSAKNISNTATEKLSNSAAEIENTASKSIISQIGDGTAVKSEMTADGITNTAEGGTIYNKSKDILNEASGDILNFADGEIGNVATKITNITGNNTVTSDTNGTTFENTANSTAIKEGTITNTTISGNTLETGQATMDYADVMKDLGVHGKATIDGDTSVGGNLSVTGTSTLTGDVTMKSKATVEKDLTVNGKSTLKGGLEVTNGTTTDTLKVTGSSEFGGKATFNDIVTMNKGLSVTGGVTADTVTAESYTVKGTDIKIDKDGINAGGKVIKNVGQGDISEGSTDAVSGGQLYETNTRVSGLETRMGTVETKVDKLDNKIDKVGANAAAMANLHPLEFDEDSKWNIAAAVGSSGSETASAVGVFYRPNENVMVNASAAMGTGENMFGGGVSLRLGHGGNKAKEAQMKAAAKENRELRAKVDDLTARMDALLSVLNPNMSKDFPDVPENHWAYEAVSRLAGNGIVEGYEDGKYHGERQMTRYEMAEIIYNALSKGAKAEKKLVEEFRPELQAMAAQKKA